MALSIKHPEADRLARALAAQTGESLTEAIISALRERLIRQQARHRGTRLSQTLMDVGRRCAALAVVDARPVEDVLGYDEHGVPR
jgi:antitoxin VapB